MKELQKYFLLPPPHCLVSRKFWHPCLASGQTKEGENKQITFRLSLFLTFSFISPVLSLKLLTKK